MRSRATGAIGWKSQPVQQNSAFKLGNNWIVHASAAPTVRPDGTTLIDGDRWYQPTTTISWVRLNSQWVSNQIFKAVTGDPGAQNSTTAVAFFVHAPEPYATKYNLLVRDFVLNSYVSGTNNGTSYWTSTMSRRNAANTNTALAAAATTAAQSAYTWVTTRTAASLSLDLTANDVKTLVINVIPVSTPGTFFGSAHFHFQLTQ